jgi:CRP-like cAMP-binding protein
VLPVTNHLIDGLPRQDRRRMLTICEPVNLVLAEELGATETRTRHVYFPTRGFVSLVARLEGKPALEVGMVGNEGMCGIHIALGARSSPLRAVVQGAGLAGRATTADFQRELNRSGALRQTLNRYAHVSMLQLASMAACLRYHHIGPRLARWLLMTHDRAHADTFQVTHEFLAYMLGVRRVGITDAAGGFQRLRLIHYRRGEMTILNRRGLEATACSCYVSDLKTYAAFLQ